METHKGELWASSATTTPELNRVLKELSTSIETMLTLTRTLSDYLSSLSRTYSASTPTTTSPSDTTATTAPGSESGEDDLDARSSDGELASNSPKSHFLTDLDQLAALEQAATPGPWEWQRSRVTTEYGLSFCTINYPNLTVTGYEPEVSLIVAARNALPELIERVREAEAGWVASDARAARNGEIADAAKALVDEVRAAK